MTTIDWPGGVRPTGAVCIDFEFKVEPGKKYFVNAGSVGKPKDNDPRACYVVL